MFGCSVLRKKTWMFFSFYFSFCFFTLFFLQILLSFFLHAFSLSTVARVYLTHPPFLSGFFFIWLGFLFVGTLDRFFFLSFCSLIFFLPLIVARVCFYISSLLSKIYHPFSQYNASGIGLNPDDTYSNFLVFV